LLAKRFRLPHKGSFFYCQEGKNIGIDVENQSKYCLNKKNIVILPHVLLAAI